MKELLLLLKRFFGYTTFRPLQAEIIQRILQKEDSLVLMPTGGGKSICFQLPAIYMPGTAIVVSPLIALMKDQVEGLIANGIPASTLNSMMPEEERHRVRQLCIQGKVKLLYISPEGIISELHWLLPRIDISLIAIDEAHCISHWGHDFRPEYTQLSVLKENFPKAKMVEPEGTYLVWMDCSAFGMTSEELEDTLKAEAKIWLNAGTMYGPGGEGYMRWNIACPRATLEEGLRRFRAFAEKAGIR